MLHQKQAELLCRPASALAHSLFQTINLLAGYGAYIFFQLFEEINRVSCLSFFIALVWFGQIFQDFAVCVAHYRF